MQKLNQFISERLSLNKALLFVLVVLAVILFNSFKVSMSDFETYYYSSIMAFDAPYKHLIFQPAELCKYVSNELQVKGFYAGFTHPPNICFYYFPFTVFEIFYAKLINNVISILLFIIALKRLATAYNINPKWLILIPVIFYFPLRSNIYFGQFYLILFFLLSESLLALEHKRYTLASFLLSVAIVTKIFPLLLLIYMLIAYPFKVSFRVIVFCFTFLMISISIQGVPLWKLYITDVFPRTNFGEIHASFSYYFQTFFLFFKMMFVYDELRNPLPLINNYGAFLTGVVLIKSLILILAVGSTLKNKKNLLYNYSLWIGCAILLLPNTNTYTMIFFLFTLFFYLNKYSLNYLLVGISVIFVFFICWVPVYKMLHLPFIIRYSKLIAMLLFFSMLIITEGVIMQLKYCLISFSLALLSSLNLFFRERKTKSAYLITKEKAELMSQLYLKNDTLCYAYWSPNGEIQGTSGIKDTLHKKLSISIRDRNILVDRKVIVQGNDLKLSPVLVNDELYYLSDLNQGYGFYTIRKMKVPQLN